MKRNEVEILEELQSLREDYAIRLPDKLSEIDAHWRMLGAVAWDPAGAAVLQRLTHSLAGSGSTFGYPELGEIARSAEQLLKAWLQDQRVPDSTQRVQLENLLGKLHQAAAISPAGISHSLNLDVAVQKRAANQEQPLVYLIEDDTALADELALQLLHFGYRIEVFNDIEGVADAVATQRPDAFIADINLPDGDMAGVHLLGDLQKRYGPYLPVVFISTHNDFNARLAAVRAGGEAYFVKPLEIAPLIDRLDRLTRSEDMAPYRILAIDDDQTLVAHHALLLRQAGMEVRTVTRAEEIMEALADFKPELILMDVYMPSCSGLELAKLIRQLESCLGIPIVFLSTETDVEKQFKAMHMGGDDFLTKPIEDQHLVSSITVRAERARTLNALMVQDSLTGLYKHTMIKEQLAEELSRSKRENTPLSFAMIDIDKFKDVNDTYGHLMGDRVIKSLARLLKQRLRKSDHVGRYGGEEFAVVLPNCGPAAAAKMLDRIRQDFSELHYQFEDQEFSVTFSAGISSYPTHGTAEEINQSADEALYEAKQQGRNRIVTDETG